MLFVICLPAFQDTIEIISNMFSLNRDTRWDPGKWSAGSFSGMTCWGYPPDCFPQVCIGIRWITDLLSRRRGVESSRRWAVEVIVDMFICRYFSPFLPYSLSPPPSAQRPVLSAEFKVQRSRFKECRGSSQRSVLSAQCSVRCSRFSADQTS